MSPAPLSRTSSASAASPASSAHAPAQDDSVAPAGSRSDATTTCTLTTCPPRHSLLVHAHVCCRGFQPGFRRTLGFHEHQPTVRWWPVKVSKITAEIAEIHALTGSN